MQQEDSFSLINILFQAKESTNVKKIFDIIRGYESLNNQHIHIQARKKALHNIILSAASIYGKHSLTSQTTNIYPIQNQSIELKKQFLKQQQLLKYQLQRYNQSSQKAKQKLRIKFQNIYRQCKENSDFIVKKEYFKLIGILLNNYDNIRNRVPGRGNVAIPTRNRNPRRITSSIKQRTRQLLEDYNSYHEIKRIVKIPISSIKAIKNRMMEI